MATNSIVLRTVCAILPSASTYPPLGGLSVTLDNYDDLFSKELTILRGKGWCNFTENLDGNQVLLYENDVVSFILRRSSVPIEPTDDILTIVKCASPIKWHRFFSSQIDYFEQQHIIFSQLTNLGPIIPPRSRVFYPEECTAPNNINIVIVAQDPYPQAGFAMGLAFSVHGHTRYLPTANTKIQEELVREFSEDTPANSDTGVAATKPFRFKGNGDFSIWAKERGVFLMNINNTTIEEQPNAHKHCWMGYADARIRYICKNNKKIVFMLWGRDAQKVKASITGSHLILESSHPAASINKVADSFVGCDHFLKANIFRIKNKLDPIDWTL